jgi:hypothetical protein
MAVEVGFEPGPGGVSIPSFRAIQAGSTPGAGQAAVVSPWASGGHRE